MFTSRIFKATICLFVKSNFHYIDFVSQRMSSTANKCTVAVCQFTATNDKLQNLQIVKRLVNKAAQGNAKVCFPNLFKTVFVIVSAYYTTLTCFSRNRRNRGTHSGVKWFFFRLYFCRKLQII